MIENNFSIKSSDFNCEYFGKMSFACAVKKFADNLGSCDANNLQT